MLFGSVVKVRCPQPGEKDAGHHRGQITACYNLPVENRLRVVQDLLDLKARLCDLPRQNAVGGLSFGAGVIQAQGQIPIICLKSPKVSMSHLTTLIVVVGWLVLASLACDQASTPSPQARSTQVYATITARAKVVASDATARAKSTAAAATAIAPVTATARAQAAATAIATVAPKITARVATATARAAWANPTGTARATSAIATATNAGILASAPAEVNWYWDGERRRWTWSVEFKEIAGRTTTVKKRDTDIYTVDGGHYVDPGGSTVSIVIAPYGSGVDNYWIRASIESNFHDATCVLTYKAVDEKGVEISLQAVTKLKDEEE